MQTNLQTITRSFRQPLYRYGIGKIMTAHNNCISGSCARMLPTESWYRLIELHIV